ncbi:4-(cytidine 5'-diphospho)-2-C-methyl-D-erythritol kinase [Neotabrizicola shimadae]|uniref:4-diphosphocytidyl-2-C-methyl-D-erythritol kinase n=1 Tax=Neotabrizicola shimadae TaxID=2807096 RepID=A0A8G0ZRA6_9RHOB|nr:4-(cytidine 5'-diphospho)-2-C-methyl-D-erythritol kinase [Neotabrizicola shimadae]QYZ68989.1 4-(cytidine 5'-diphospho)-2-C-methyl-D-erythritol kinase [Neotabrizicola shimadae]
MAAEPVTEFAPAKINLALHVTGRRADGYHLLDSLVVFVGTGDRVTAAPSEDLTLTLTGPRSTSLAADDDNLVLRAARAMGSGGAALVLEKHLPVASGIGGGSAGAAAPPRALSRLRGQPLPPAAAVLALGADVPVCLAGQPARMSGIGETLAPLDHPLPEAWLVLANPGVAVSTPAIFAALARRDNAPLPRDLPRLRTAADLSAFLRMARNDLEAPAAQLVPVISVARSALSAQPGCLMSRMSGSGATCFGLFPDALTAAAAARALRSARPDWWIEAAPILP